MKLHVKPTRKEESNLFAQTVFKYLPYWPLFLLFLVIAIAGSWVYLRYTTPLYESSARILVKDEKKGTDNSRVMEELNMLSSKKIIENEIEVIQSRTLLNEVTKNLHLYAPVFEKGQVRNASAYTTSPVKVEVPDMDKIKEVQQVPFTYDNQNLIVIIGGNKYPLSRWVTTPYGRLMFTPNSRYKQKTKRSLFFSLNDPRNIISSLQSRLKLTTASKQSSILDLTLRDEVPERGEDILNELIRTYSAAMVNDKNLLAVNTMSFVEDRLKSVENDLETIEHKNEQFKARESVINIGEQGKLFLQNVSLNDQKIADINMQMAVLDQVETYVRSKNKSGGIVPSTLGITDPMLSQLTNKLYTSELEYEGLKGTTAENNPAMLALTDQIEKIKPSILENVQSQRKSLEASKTNLGVTNNSYSSVLQGIPGKERELIEINREQSIKNSIYAFLLQKREEAALSQASTVSDSRVIDKAGSSVAPVTPKPKVVYLSAILGAFFVGMGLILAKETLSRKILFRSEIEELTDQPIIGEIVSERSKGQLVIGDYKKTFIAEQFRRLRTSLNFIGINPQHKRILITSAIGGEGKSFVAANLAISLALTDKKVVLIDCDLNNPSLHKKLKMENVNGVTEFLSGEINPDEIIRPTTIHENLFFIPTGRLPHNPSELIMNGQIEELLNYLDANFDYVVVDTAPVSPVTDAYILSPYCNATLFVIRHKYTPKIFVQRIDENNKINQLNNLAIVFNGVRGRGFGSQNYGYGYGYGYIHKESRYKLRKTRSV